MKKLLLGGCLLLASVSTVVAQEKSLREFRQKYKGCAETTSIKLGGLSLRLAGWVMSFDKEDEDVNSVRALLKDIRRVKVHTIENLQNARISSQDVATLIGRLQDKDHFETLMEVRDKGSMVHILNKGKADELGHVVMLIEDTNEFTMVDLETNLKITDINRLINQFASN